MLVARVSGVKANTSVPYQAISASVGVQMEEKESISLI
jgi:hypothetical protein